MANIHDNELVRVLRNIDNRTLYVEDMKERFYWLDRGEDGKWNCSLKFNLSLRGLNEIYEPLREEMRDVSATILCSFRSLEEVLGAPELGGHDFGYEPDYF